MNIIVTKTIGVISFVDDNGNTNTAIVNATPEVIDYNLKQEEILAAARNWVDIIENNIEISEEQSKLIDSIRHITHRGE